jgi:hypothetical protein
LLEGWDFFAPGRPKIITTEDSSSKNCDNQKAIIVHKSTSIATSRAILDALFFPLSTVFAGILVFWTQQPSRGGGGRTFNGSIPCFMF